MSSIPLKGRVEHYISCPALGLTVSARLQAVTSLAKPEKPYWMHRTEKSKTAIVVDKNQKPKTKLEKTRNRRKTTKPKNRTFQVRKPKNRAKNWPNPRNRKSQRPPHSNFENKIGARRCFHQQQLLYSCRAKTCVSTFRSCSVGINRFWLVGFFRVPLKKAVFGWFAWSTFSTSFKPGWNGWKSICVIIWRECISRKY